MSVAQSFTATSRRRIRLMLAAHVLWIGTVFILGGWWVLLVQRQAERIAELERVAGLTQAAQNWERTHRMIVWESGTFFVLLLATAGLILWMYWRDMRRSRSLQAFFASVTHELRTPLTSIRLQAESIADCLAENASAKPLLQRLLEDTQRLEGQVERALELARIEGGGALHCDAVELRPWLGRMIEGWRENYGSLIDIKTELPDLIAKADPTALRIIFRNLLENALKHSGKEKVQIRVSAEKCERGIEVRFADDGESFKGSPHKLGTMFHRGPGSQGSGVGLYLIRVLTEQMGGRAAFSPVSQGFEVRLELREATPNE